MNKIIVGNWKLYPTFADSVVLSGTIKRALEEIKGVEVVIAPPLPWLVPIYQGWKHKLPHLHLAAQNIWPDDQGAYTGEISAYMLKSIIQYAIIGHSERRRYESETNELINKKVQSSLRWGITPILCIGEEEKVINSDGSLDAYRWSRLTKQLIEGLAGVTKEKLSEVLIAYEPVWAIGSHNPSKPEYVTEIIVKLREELIKQYGATIASQIRFLYGGSVTAENATNYLRGVEISGLLCGNMSVKANDFIHTCRLAAELG